MAEFNYEVVEELHQSKLWNNHIFKVKVKGKEKFYVLKLFGGVNESFQKLIFNREMEALKVLNACNNIVKIRDTTASTKYKGVGNYGAILMDFVEGRTLDKYDWHRYTQLKKYEICFKILPNLRRYILIRIRKILIIRQLKKFYYAIENY